MDIVVYVRDETNTNIRMHKKSYAVCEEMEIARNECVCVCWVFVCGVTCSILLADYRASRVV